MPFQTSFIKPFAKHPLSSAFPNKRKLLAMQFTIERPEILKVDQ